MRNDEVILLFNSLEKKIDSNDEKMHEFIKASSTLTRAKMESEVDRINEMDKLRNGRIGQNEEDIEELQEETRPARWVYRNPKVSAVILIVVIMLGAWGYHNRIIRGVIENKTGIVIESDQ